MFLYLEDLNARISIIEVCQDGILTETFDDGSTGGEDSWLDDADTWDEMKAHARAMCNM